MNNVTLSNILWAAAPDQGFAIYGSVENESDYNEKVVYNLPTSKPTWAAVQDGQNPEQWKVVRAERDGLLSSSDWTSLPDVPLSDSKRSEWEVYRQALRNITDQPDPFNITWPVPPT